MTTSSRPIAIAVVVALVATLVVLLPSASPTTPLGGLVASAQASDFPAPSRPLPPCDPETGRGGCVRAQDMTISASGQFSGVGSSIMVGGSGLPACVKLYHQEQDQSPNPCHTSVGTSLSGCLVVDLWAGSSRANPSSSGGGRCGASFSESAETSLGTRRSCDGSGDFGTYIYGGPANAAGARWSEWSAGLEANCEITMTREPVGGFSGPAWVRVTRTAGGWRDYYGDSEYVTAVADAWVPIQVKVRNRGPIIECEGTDLGGGRYRFTVTDIDHPLDLGTDHIRWWFGTGEEGFDETVGTGMSIEYTFPTEDSSSWVDWLNVTVTDSDGVSAYCRADRPEPKPVLSVELALADGVEQPVRMDEPFDVDLRISTPSQNPGDVLGVAAEQVLALPDFLELVDGTLAGGFDLAPGEQRTATLTLQATEAGKGKVTSAWSGVDGDANGVTGEAELEVEAAGTLDGAWFRSDGKGDSVPTAEAVEVRLRVDNDSRRALTGVKLLDSSVTPVDDAGDADGGDGPAPGDGPAAGDAATGAEAPPSCPERPAAGEEEPASPDEPGGGDADAEPTTKAAEAVLTRVATSSLRGTLDATGPDSVDFLDFTLEGVEPGEVLLCALVTGQDDDGETLTETVEATWEVKPQGLDVEIDVDLRREDGSAWELNSDNDGDGDIDDDDHRFPVEVAISNTTDLPITDLSWLDEAEPVDWSNNLVGEDQGAPKLTFLGYEDGLDGGVGTGGFVPLAKAIPDLAASGEEGDEFTVTYWYEATGEIDADGQVVVLGAQDDRTIRGSAETEIQIVSGILLEFSSWLKEPDRLTTSGQVVRLGGYVENLDEDEVDENGEVVEEARPIAVWITPLTEGNAGGGYLVAREGGRTPIGAEFIEVAPGERVDLHGILATLASPKRTDARVRYLVSAWQVPEVVGDTALEVAAERIDVVVDEDKGWGDEHDKRLVFADLSPDDLRECQSHFYVQIASCNFVLGLQSLYFNTVDAVKMAEQGVGEIGSSTYWVGAWYLNQLGDVVSAVANDPAAQQRLLTEIEVQLQTFKELGIVTVDTGVSAVGVLDEFLRETDRVLQEGDTEAGLAWISKFAGENPDLLFSAILKARTLGAMGQTFLKEGTESAAATAVRESVEAEAKAAQRAINENVDAAIARAADPKMPSTGALRSGMDVTNNPKVWRDVYGAARDDMQKLFQIAREEGILIAFRSRSPISIKFLEDGLAWLKPQSVKAKNVNAIDVAYLGFPQDSFGKVAMVEPPIDFRLKGDDLTRAIDDHMAKLKSQHPELVDEVYAREVRERLQMRTEKYSEHLSEWLEYADTGMPVGFDGAANGVKKGNLNVTELRDAKLEVTFVPDPYNPGKTLARYDLLVAGPGGGDYRFLTGDIDVVGFFNLDRTPIMGAAKRERIYEKMRATGMQHGETLTWDHKKRAELLREHIGDDAELLVVAGPDEKAYLSALDEKKSSEVFAGDNFKDTFSLLDGPPVELKSPVRGPGPAPSGALVRSTAANQTTQALQRFKQPADIVDQLKKIAKESDGQITVEEQQSKDGPAVVVLPDGRMVIYRVPDGSFANAAPPAGGPGVRPTLRSAALGITAAPDPTPVERSTSTVLQGDDAAAFVAGELGGYRHTFPRPAVGRLGGRWEETGFAAAAAEGDPGVFELPLMSWTDVTVRPGDTTLSVLVADDLGVPGGDWFAPGDRIVFDPGGAYEQVLTLTAVDGNRLSFAASDGLLPDHDDVAELPEGVQVLFVPARAAGGSAGVGGDAGGSSGGAPTGGGTAGGGTTDDGTTGGDAVDGTVGGGDAVGGEADDGGGSGGGDASGSGRATTDDALDGTTGTPGAAPTDGAGDDAPVGTGTQGGGATATPGPAAATSPGDDDAGTTSGERSTPAGGAGGSSDAPDGDAVAPDRLAKPDEEDVAAPSTTTEVAGPSGPGGWVLIGLLLAALTAGALGVRRRPGVATSRAGQG